MARNFHEAFERGEVPPPSERSTGIVFAVVALIVAVIFRNHFVTLVTACAIAALLLILSFAAPAVLKPLNLLWFRFGLVLHRIVNPLVMGLVFALVMIPAGLIMRALRDPLLSKRPDGDSYWLSRDEAETRSQSMTNQF